jgi:antitoxin component of MazEF toxin-antitoxin module
MATRKTDGVTFETVLTATGNNTGIVVPPEVLEALGGGKRPSVVVDVDGYGFECTIGSMGGHQMIAFSAARRRDTGLVGGDPVTVTLLLADGPRAVEVPADLAEALAANPSAEAFFRGLSNSLQRFHVDNVNGAKSDDTRSRRIHKAIELFSAGKAR